MRLIKKICAYCLIIYFVIAPPIAMAASPAGWAMTAFNLPTNTLTAVKNGVTVAVSAAPSASTVGSYAIKFAGAAAIAYAVAKYGGQAIDWVLDPANNSVRSKPGSNIAGGATMFCNWYDECQADIYNYSTAAAAGEATCASYSETFVSIKESPPYADGQYLIVVCKKKDGSLDFWNTKVKIVTGDKVVSADEIGNDILNKAKAGDSAMTNVVNDAMADEVNKGAHDAALDKAAAQKTSENESHNCGTGTTWNGSACVADPAKPADAAPLDLSSILSALQSIYDAIKGLASAIVEPIVNMIDLVIQTINDAWQRWIDIWTEFKTKVFDFIDWVRGDFDNSDDVKPDVDKTPPTKSARDFDANYINFGGQCPTFQSVTVSVGLVSVPISFNAQPLCDFAILCRPAILALAYFAAMAIVANAIRSD